MGNPDRHIPCVPTPELAGNFRILDAPTHAKTQTLYDYWKSRLNGHDIPLRADVSPLHIPKLLPNIGLVDVDRTDGIRFKVRLYGTEAVENSREERTGRFVEELAHDLTDLERQSTIERWQKACSYVLETRRPAFTQGRPMDPQRQHQIVHTAILPLSTTGKNIDQLLGLLVTETKVDDL